MKNAFALLLLLASVCASDAGVKLSADAWDRVKLYNVRELAQVQTLKINRIVGIRFRNRSEKMRHLKPNWYQSALWQPDRSARRGYASISVLVAKKDLAAFERLPSDFRSPISLVIYGRILSDAASHFTFVQLYGVNATLDDAGNATIDWDAPPSVTRPSPVRRSHR